MISKNTFLTVFAISIALIFLMAPVGAASHSISPAASTSNNYQPIPTLNTNVTWSTYNSSWGELEYYNGTGYQNLSAYPNSNIENPITVNTGDIVANGSLQNDKVAGTIWNTKTPTVVNNEPGTGAVATAGTSTIGGVTEPYISLNTSAAGEDSAFMSNAPNIGVSQLPSNNLQYDYITYGATLSGPNITGVYAYLGIYNGTTNTFNGLTIHPGQSIYASMSFAYLQQLNGGKGFNTTGTGAATEYLLQPYIYVSQSTTSGTFTLTINSIALTQYPYLLGENATGSTQNIIKGEAHLSTFKPTAQMTIYKNGYTVAVTQQPQNLTSTQTPITSGNYIEQVQYSGTFQLPSAPDLSYGYSNITFPMTVPASQVQVLTVAGNSYINALGNKTNGTVQLISGLDPTSPTSYYAIVEYTASQWQSISHPAGFFTYDGIAYYYWLAIGAIASLLGLGVGVRHANTKREQTEKVDRITRRGR